MADDVTVARLLFVKIIVPSSVIDVSVTPPGISISVSYWPVRSISWRLPNPIPSVGAKVRVTGSYAVTFTKATGGAAANPRFGILTAYGVETIEPAPNAATLGKRRP